MYKAGLIDLAAPLLFSFDSHFLMLTLIRQRLFADPFLVTEEEPVVDPELAEQVHRQAPATRLELWGYYLYYNGVRPFPSKEL